MQIQHLINGAAVRGTEYFETINPATREVLAEVARGGEREIEAAVAAAKAAFPAIEVIGGARDQLLGGLRDHLAGIPRFRVGNFRNVFRNQIAELAQQRRAFGGGLACPRAGLFEIMKAHFAEQFAKRGLALSLELNEFSEAGTLKHNNLHARFKKP